MLDLPSFDLILGMDWLERFSPMKVHWQQKWLCIPYQGMQVMLHGCSVVVPIYILLHITPISASPISADEVALDPAISSLLSQFAPVFAKPTSLPPVRACVDSIPLNHGATSVNIRPYRYPPALKDEIENRSQRCCRLALLDPVHLNFALLFCW